MEMGGSESRKKEKKAARVRAMARAVLSPHGLVRGDAMVEERERLAGGGAAAGERAALDVLERDEPGRRGRGGEVAEDVLEEALVAGERDGPGAGAGGEAVLLLRLPEQLPEHRVVQVRRPHHEPPRRAAHAHGHVARRDNRLPGRRRRARGRVGTPPPQRLPEPDDRADLAAALGHRRVSEMRGAVVAVLAVVRVRWCSGGETGLAFGRGRCRGDLYRQGGGGGGSRVRVACGW
jgi:hypothetical protein